VKPLSLFMEMYLKPASALIYNWYSVLNHDDGSGRVRAQEEIDVTRGYADLNSDPRPSQCVFTVNDPDDEFSRLNPLGTWYGSMGKGVAVRTGVTRFVDPFTRTETNQWGTPPATVPNESTDVWVNGSASGGTVAATNWTVSSGTAKHSVPVANAYRSTDLSPSTRLMTDCEVRVAVTMPVVGATAAPLGSQISMRQIDINNRLQVDLQVRPTTGLMIAFIEWTGGVRRVLIPHTAIDGALSTSQTVNVAAQVEGSAVRAKAWLSTAPEPRDWQVIASRATIREGYVSVVSYVDTGNTNTKPLVFGYDNLSVRLLAFTGEVASIVSSGDGKSEAKVAKIQAAGYLRRIQAGNAPRKSAMVRSRTTSRRWLRGGTLRSITETGSVSQLVCTDADADAAVSDRFFLLTLGLALKEENIFTITGMSSSAGNTTVSFTPDALSPINIGDSIEAIRIAAVPPVGFWPCDDGDNASQINSALPDGDPLAVRYAIPDYGSVSDSKALAPFLQFNGAELIGPVKTYTDTAQAFTIVFMLDMPEADDPATGSALIDFYTEGGSAYAWVLQYTAGGDGSFRLMAFSKPGVAIYDSGAVPFGLRGQYVQITLNMWQDSPGVVKYNLVRQKLPTPAGGSLVADLDNTVTGVGTLGKITKVAGNPGGGYINVGFGYLTVVPEIWTYINVFTDLMGWTGDRGAGGRLTRLGFEENIPYTFHTDEDIPSAALGGQAIDSLANQLKETAESDHGFLYEPRGALGIEMRTRGSLTNQEPLLTLSVADGQVQHDFEPVDDDANVSNKVTVQRRDGASAVAEQTTGRLSTSQPPDGLGVFDDSFTLSLSSDTRTQPQADWRLAVGTVDEYRLPKLTTTPATMDAVSIEKLMAVNLGSRVDVTGLETWHMYDGMSQLVLGSRVRLNKFAPMFEFDCAPYSPYRTLALTNDDHARFDGVDSNLAGVHNSSTTTLSVSSISGSYLWTTLAGDFPLDILVAGERMTVTNITGSSAPQTFTVVRAVNGVVKSHVGGAIVELAEPNYWQFR